MRPIPRDTSFDSSFEFLRDPYGFISERCRHHRTDVFQTRLMLRPAICMTGPEAAALFSDERRFVRSGAMPARIQKTLFGQGGVQGLDDDPHRHRKRMFMSLMTPERIAQLGEVSAHWWRVYADRWAAMNEVVLYDQACEILTRAICAWSSVPLEEEDVGRRTRELTALFQFAGAIGLKHWRTRWVRRSAERWIADLVLQIRAGRLSVPHDSAAHIVATFRDFDGELLEPRIAAVELINVLRPTVAVAVFIVFTTHALHQHPAWRAKLVAGRDVDEEIFVQEVRRFYPFFPLVAALVREDFEWNGFLFPRGTWTLLDLYGTNHDARAWSAPDEFRPERFEGWEGNPFTFIPQGGGNHHRHHRCPGEWIAIELMKVALRFFVGGVRYEVPEQDLRIDRSRLPPLPRSGFLLKNVTPVSEPKPRTDRGTA